MPSQIGKYSLWHEDSCDTPKYVLYVTKCKVENVSMGVLVSGKNKILSISQMDDQRPQMRRARRMLFV